jgi:hypothetical protein
MTNSYKPSLINPMTNVTETAAVVAFNARVAATRAAVEKTANQYEVSSKRVFEIIQLFEVSKLTKRGIFKASERKMFVMELKAISEVAALPTDITDKAKFELNKYFNP